jgi:hypothetical protein
MIRFCLACLALAICFLFTFRAEAKQPAVRVLGTPSIGPALSIVMLVRPLPPRLILVPGPDGALAWITRNIEGQRSHALVRSSDDRSREGMLRELAMTAREDTSLGIRSAQMSAWGAGIVGFGLCGAAALWLGDAQKRSPGIVGPLGFPGGGGISLARNF